MTKIADGLRVVRIAVAALRLFCRCTAQARSHLNLDISCRVQQRRSSEVSAMKISRLFAAGILFLAPVFSQNISPKLAKDLPDVDSRGVTDVIVQFTNPASDDEHRNIASLGGRRKSDLGLINSAVYSLPAAALPALSRMPNIEYVSPDREVMATLDYVAPTVGSSVAFTTVSMAPASGSRSSTAESWTSP